MSNQSYIKKLAQAVSRSESCLCIGLDPHLDLFPGSLNREIPDVEERVSVFLKGIINATLPHCAAYKPNLAFFESLGKRGMEIFGDVIEGIPDDKIIIADAKRGDIGSTAKHYASAFFNRWKVDALTLNPLMGFETLVPYFNYPGNGLYILSLTSNPGSSDFLARPFEGFDSIAEYIAEHLRELQPESASALGMVVGATRVEQLKNILGRHPAAPLLIPGIGRQGGDIEELISVLGDHKGIPLISSSRSILFGQQDGKQWQEKAAARAENYKRKLTPITQRYV